MTGRIEYLQGVLRTYNKFKKSDYLTMTEVLHLVKSMPNYLNGMPEGSDPLHYLIMGLQGVNDNQDTLTTPHPTEYRKKAIQALKVSLIHGICYMAAQKPCTNIYAISRERFNHVSHIPVPPGFKLDNEYLTNPANYPMTVIINGEDLLYFHWIDEINYVLRADGALVVSDKRVREIVCLYFPKDAPFPFCEYIPIIIEPTLSLETFLTHYTYEPIEFDNRVVVPHDRLKKTLVDISQFVINFLFLIQSKNMETVYTEFNPQRVSLEKNIAEGRNAAKAEHQLKKIPSYKFVDVDLMLEEYSIKYRAANAGTGTGKSPTPHWRSAHYNTYWVGPKNQPELRKQIVHYIPDLWVGDPGQMTDQTIIKIVK